LFASYQKLIDQGWQLDVIIDSQPAGTEIALPIVALHSTKSGPALWLISGIHGEEPAGPNAVAAAIDDIAALGKQYPVVLLPLMNPHGYVRNWRYLNVPIYSVNVEGQSVGDSSHVLPDANNPGTARAVASSDEAAAISRYILKMLSDYPPRYSVDLHEDDLISEGYVYSQGELGAADPLAAEAVKILRDNNIGIRMSGKTRFDEDIVEGIIGPVVDSSIDEFMSADLVIDDGRKRSGPGAATVLVFETPADDLSLERRVDAPAQLIRRIMQLIASP
jgi:predicted deacylase